MNKKSFNRFYKIGIVVLLIAVVAIIVITKNRKPGDIPITDMPVDSSAVVDSIAVKDSLAQISDEDTSTTTVPQEDSLSLQAIPIPPDTGRKIPSLPEHVLAKVNDESITAAKFDSIFNSMPAQAKDYFKDDKVGFLEELIVRELLIQDAHRKKIQETPEYKATAAKNPGNEEDVLINVLISTVAAGVSLTEAELREFFEQYKDQLPNKDYESVKEQIRPMALEEKQRVVIEDYINELKSNAKIVRNDKWMEKQEAQVADNPLAKALKSGKPVVADFGRGTCVPCKMMEPILKKLQEDYQGKAEILILDVGEYAALSRKYKIQLIPTQIFFDANGKEIHRHQGFMSEADIIVQLKKMGVE